jgi:hypothetical protein
MADRYHSPQAQPHTAVVLFQAPNQTSCGQSLLAIPTHEPQAMIDTLSCSPNPQHDVHRDGPLHAQVRAGHPRATTHKRDAIPHLSPILVGILLPKQVSAGPVARHSLPCPARTSRLRATSTLVATSRDFLSQDWEEMWGSTPVARWSHLITPPEFSMDSLTVEPGMSANLSGMWLTVGGRWRQERIATHSRDVNSSGGWD